MREVTAEAPGRVNLIGEHTDYHEGFVMPLAVPQRTRARLRPRHDRQVRAWSAQMASDPVEFELGAERRGAGWGDYVQGITWALAQAGLAIGGFELNLDSDVPPGSGLSSSAALEIATLRALRAAYDLPLTDVPMARLAQQAEVEFVGAPVGIMDHMAASLAGEHDALFLDTRTLDFERITLPAALELVVINSGITHQHAGGDYVTRRRESEQAARQLGVGHLRDVELAELPRIDRLSPVLARRARHVVTENERVLAARRALLHGDLAAFGRLLSASHTSLRDDYEVTVPLVDLLVRIAESEDDVFGARMTGGGFGGAVVIAVASGRGRDVAVAVTSAYAQLSGQAPVVLIP